MSRTAAKVTQADVARALRAAQSLGPHWRVRIGPDGSIELWQGTEPAAPPLAAGEKLDVAPAREIVL